MVILRIEHPVDDFDEWKRAFDSDPVGRERGGVRRYRVMRGLDDPMRVMIDLEFDGRGEAEAFRSALRELWGRVDVMRDPEATVAELVESEELGSQTGA
jgi:hypothetical protein